MFPAIFFPILFLFQRISLLYDSEHKIHCLSFCGECGKGSTLCVCDLSTREKRRPKRYVVFCFSQPRPRSPLFYNPSLSLSHHQTRAPAGRSSPSSSASAGSAAASSLTNAALAALFSARRPCSSSAAALPPAAAAAAEALLLFLKAEEEEAAGRRRRKRTTTTTAMEEEEAGGC